MRIGVTGLLVVVTLVAAACGGGAAEHPSTPSRPRCPFLADSQACVSPTSPATTGPTCDPASGHPPCPRPPSNTRKKEH